MQVELSVTLKSGKTTWRKGLILDDEKAPFPEGIAREIEAETGNVRIIKSNTPDDKGINETEATISFEEINQKRITKAFGIDTNSDKKITKTAILKMNKHDLAVLLGDESLEESKSRNELIDMAVEKLDDAS